MMQRVLTAAVGAPLALAALFLLPRFGFFVLVLALCLVAAFELAKLAIAIGAGKVVRGLPVFVLLASLLLNDFDFSADAFGLADRRLMLLILVTLGCALAALWSRGPVKERTLALVALSFGALYLALPAVSFDQLRSRDPWLVVLLLMVVWLTDTGAFLVGSKWGRRKLAPAVSPNKSWEGAIGGLVLGMVAAGAWSWLRLGSLEPNLLAVGALVSTAGQTGDLVESLFKRTAGVKDSGKLLPGHGGMLDRLDSLLVAGPVLELACRWVSLTGS